MIRCSTCGREWGIGDWPFCPHGAVRAVNANRVHKSEAAMVWKHPGTGAIRYPDRNDRQMPARYRRQGYVEERLDSLHSLDKFCKERGVVNEKAHFDSNGKGLDVAE